MIPGSASLAVTSRRVGARRVHVSRGDAGRGRLPACRSRHRAFVAVLATPLALAGCGGMQSALSPAGREAETLASLFWVMLVGAVVIWIAVNGLFLYVTRLNPKPMSGRVAEGIIIGGGIVFPLFVLLGLLAYSLPLMQTQREPGDGLVVRVTGEQWWWRVEYRDADGEAVVVSANEIVLPVGERTDVMLTSDKVIHSFWIPALAGKMDMFPGRETRLALEPTEAGEFRGQCAEFCGASHALMAFRAVTMPRPEFDAWLAAQREPAVRPDTPLARAGEAVFMAEGCGACHAVRGTAAVGRYGPDLTHVGSRRSLGAAVLDNDPRGFRRWIRHTGLVKPDVDMPTYDHLDDASLDALAHYLEGLS